MKATIAINGRFLTRQPTGVDRFALELLQAWLGPTPDTKNVRVLVPRSDDMPPSGVLPLQAQEVGFSRGHAWEQLELPRYCSGDMLLNLCNSAPIYRKRQLAVLHDASVMVNPSHYSFGFRNWYRLMCAGLMRNASLVATVSKFSASELMRFFGVRARGIEIIYESGEHILRAEADESILSRLGIGGQSYVLAVGSQTINKNFAAVVNAVELLGSAANVRIVAAGGSNNRVFSGVDPMAAKVVRTGYISNGELRALYENAECFVFPSLYEGFGLPPLEAMHCGCPVLVSNRAAIPEICGDAAAYCDPNDVADLATQLRRILSSASLRSDLREAGLARTKLFTWRQAARKLDYILGSSKL